MTKTTKLWISPALELRWNEWPEKPNYKIPPTDTGALQAAADHYYDEWEKALAKAKAESILVYADTYSPWHIIDEQFKGLAPREPDSFIDFDGSVEVVDQWFSVDGWKDCNLPEEPNELLKQGKKLRQVAHLKPVQSNPVVIPDQSDYATEEEFFNACRERRKMMKGEVEEDTMSDAEMHEALEALKDPKDARIKELEQDNAEGFEKYQELLVVKPKSERAREGTGDREQTHEITTREVRGKRITPERE